MWVTVQQHFWELLLWLLWWVRTWHQRSQLYRSVIWIISSDILFLFFLQDKHTHTHKAAKFMNLICKSVFTVCKQWGFLYDRDAYTSTCTWGSRSPNSYTHVHTVCTLYPLAPRWHNMEVHFPWHTKCCFFQPCMVLTNRKLHSSVCQCTCRSLVNIWWNPPIYMI